MTKLGGGGGSWFVHRPCGMGDGDGQLGAGKG